MQLAHAKTYLPYHQAPFGLGRRHIRKTPSVQIRAFGKKKLGTLGLIKRPFNQKRPQHARTRKSKQTQENYLIVSLVENPRIRQDDWRS